MLILDEKTMEELAAPERIIPAVERAFRILRSGGYSMPARFSCESEGLTALYMPCFTPEHFGTKALTIAPGNRALGLPSLDGVMLLNDRKTGRVCALMDAKPLTAWRTGATGALGARLLSRADAASLGIVGCGTQGLHQAVCICAVRKIGCVRLFSRNGVGEGFKSALAARLGPGIELQECRGARELVEGSDIVVTTTFSNEPVLPDDAELLRGRAYIAVGSYKPHMRELPDALIAAADRIAADLPYACEESGDLALPIASGLLRPERVEYLSGLLDAPPELRPGETTVFKTVGMALVDLTVAAEFLSAAVKAGLGTEVQF